MSQHTQICSRKHSTTGDLQLNQWPLNGGLNDMKMPVLMKQLTSKLGYAHPMRKYNTENFLTSFLGRRRMI